MPDVIGPYRGPRQEGVDYFDDVLTNNKHQIFEGDGLEDYDGVKTSRDQSGLVIDVHCRYCPLGCNITVGWDELFIVAQADKTNLLPENWRKGDENPSPFPDVHCSCRSGPDAGLVAVHIPPDRAEKEVEAAIRSNLTTPQQILAAPRVQQFLQFPLVQQMLQSGWRPVPQ